ncbi:MAG: protein translocase subunit SecF [Deltaproteobacteria bacterium]|nr:protein translocase subunit SecF [Deltaproteobacteria bacterium]
MEILHKTPSFDFIGKRRIFVPLSVGLVILSFLGFFVPGIRYGVDFAGGTVVQLRFQRAVGPEEIRAALRGLISGSPTVQSLGAGNEYIIQTEESSADLEGLSKRVRDSLATKLNDPSLEVRRVEMVGPKVGDELRRKGILAAALALAGILVYVWWRFEFYYSLGGLIAIFHDCIITVGAFILTRREFDLTALAAVLTIAGFSINDTIVIFDRVRENLRKLSGKGDLAQVMNKSINETLSRTLLTNGTVLAVVLSLFLFGGPVIHNFALAMLVGSIAGTYSTVYIASPFALFANRWLEARRVRKAAT